MPWIKSEMCTGCGICITECSAGVILMDGDIAFIDEENCIRCGVCHDICPVEAVRHDGERIPDEVQANLDWVKELLTHEYYVHDPKKQKQLVQRLLKYFTKNRKVIEKTLEQLEIMLKTNYPN
jgi:ferredoxin